MRTIIVGNGSSLLDKSNGDIIDSFDNVVRFNAYTIEGFEQHVGTKTTIWFNTINFQKKESEWRCQKAYDEILLHIWQFDKTNDLLYIEFLKHYKNAPHIFKTEKNVISDIKNYGESSTYSAFSTGLIAIWIMLGRAQTISITGFDWWEKEKHHYNDNVSRGLLHKPHIEKTIIHKLISENKITVL